MKRVLAVLAALGSLVVAASTDMAAAATTTTYLGDMSWSSATNGWGPVERNRSNGDRGATDGRTITINGTAYPKGLGVHAPSDVRFNLGGACSNFTSDVGIDDEVGSRGNVVFQVYLDGAKAWDSGAVTGTTSRKTVSLSISGKTELRLVVTIGSDNPDYDHADWAAARVTCSTATSTPPATPYTGGRFYGSASPFNQPVATGAAIDPSSSTMVQTLVSAAGSRGIVVAYNAWTVPIYYANASTARYDVKFTSSWNYGRTLYGVPIPSDAKPDAEGDGHMMIVDASTGCEYDFWVASKVGSGWQAGGGARLELEGSGVTTNGARASSFGLGAGLIRPEELASGRIDHALVFSYPYAKKNAVVPPATSGGGSSTLAGAIPTGARIQLDPTLNLDALGLAPWQRTIARALQEYGAYLGDAGGAFALYAQHSQTVPGGYPWGTGSAALPSSLASKLRVLRLPATVAPNYANVASRCGKFNW